jgi:rubredoxin
VIPVGAGKEVPSRRELVCADCGYGILVRRPPERCPMCGGTRWRTPRRTDDERLAPEKTMQGHDMTSASPLEHRHSRPALRLYPTPAVAGGRLGRCGCGLSPC